MDALSRTRTVGEVIAAMAVEMGNAGGVPAPAAAPAPVGGVIYCSCKGNDAERKRSVTHRPRAYLGVTRLPS